MENVIIDIKSIPFIRRFLSMFLPACLIFGGLIFAINFFTGKEKPLLFIGLTLVATVLCIRSFRWSKIYITKISIIKNEVKIIMKTYDTDTFCVFQLNQIRAIVSSATPRSGSYQLYIYQKINKENILQYQVGEWTKENLKAIAEILTDNAKGN